MDLRNVMKTHYLETGQEQSEENREDRARLIRRIEDAEAVLSSIVRKGLRRWIVTFSGGKDSTTTLVIALESALALMERGGAMGAMGARGARGARDGPERIDVIYADTGMEIPTIHQYAINFLNHLERMPRLAPLPVHCHVVYPDMEDRFWVCVLGKGYPPPHQRFRWCTERLKIYPAEKALRDIIMPGATAVLTGVRFGESHSRDVRLQHTCSRGGECGQGVWYQHSSRLMVDYVAPIAYWPECDVWDFLNFYAPVLGYPTAHLETGVYNGRETRFGCWMCTVVERDRTMERLISTQEWAHLRPLHEFRQRVRALTRQPEARRLRPDGRPGGLTLEVRQQLLTELLELQERLNMTLISEEERRKVEELWQDDRRR